VAKQKVKTADNGAACGLELSGTGPFLVFAYKPEGKKSGAGQVLEANLCGGTRPIGADEHPSFGKGKAVKKPEVVQTPSASDGSLDLLRTVFAFLAGFGPRA
jgi:hypothetical protein